MEMTNNLCNTCTNIGCEFQSGIVRTTCDFYMPPTVEAIPKDQYEARLKADIVSVLEEIQLEIDEKATELCDDGWWLTYNNLIQQKIDKLKEVKDGTN